MVMDEVSAAIREVGVSEVLPRFRSLAAGDIIEKGPGDLVTVADRACERALTMRLQQIRDLPVVGEEATAAEPSLLQVVDTAEAAWVVDPIDGTSNFVAGNDRFAVMVALVEAGSPTASWIWFPTTDTLVTARLGHGVKVDDEPLRRSAAPAGPAKGIIKRKYMGTPARDRLAEFPVQVGSLVPGRRSAAVEYHALATGDIDFLGYWRTLPWDHAPGGLVAAEAGLRVARYDDTPYRPGDGRVGLLAARADLWDDVAGVVNAALDV